MPSRSPAQRRLMAAAAHDPAFAKKVDVPQSVAQDFFDADQAKKKRKTFGAVREAVRAKER
jgi:predicted DNA-binding transcriptional regulator YafY